MTRKLSCRVDRIVAHGERVYSVTLRPERPAPAFRPGQFLHLALDPYDPAGFWPESRVFSIASSPARRNALDICYSVKGQFTARMESELSEGTEVWIKMPYGDFVVERAASVVLLAGGTGISAFTALLEELPTDTGGSVVLGYGARTRHLLLFSALVERCVRSVPSFRAVCFVEHPMEGGETVGPLPLNSGQVTVGAVWPLVPRPLQASYYISGPPQMLQAVRRDLRGRGVLEEAIHIDAWE